MNKKLITASLAAFYLTAGTACTSQAGTDTPAAAPFSPSSAVSTPVPPAAEKAAPAKSASDSASSGQNAAPPQEAVIPKQLDKLVFDFSTGAGGWFTALAFSKDGSFEGTYQDSDLGVSGPGYPNGTLSRCEFTGRIAGVKYEDEYTMRIRLAELNIKKPKAKEYIEDGIRYIAAGPCGVPSKGKDNNFMLYLPGKPMKTLPAACKEAGRFVFQGSQTDELPVFCIWNGDDEAAFFADESLSVYDMKNAGKVDFCSGIFKAVSSSPKPDAFGKDDEIIADRMSEKFFRMSGTPFGGTMPDNIVVLKNEDGTKTEGSRAVMTLRYTKAAGGGTIKWTHDNITGEETISYECGGQEVLYKRTRWDKNNEE